MNRKNIIISIVFILIITTIVFAPSLENGFTNWDDQALITENPMIVSLTLRSIKNIFTSFYYAAYTPLTFLSFLLEYHFFDLNPRAYHTTNLILHLAGCLLVFWLIFILTNNARISLVTSILFAIHPLRVESVAWATSRKDVLYSLFFLLSLITYLKYSHKNNRNFYSISLVLFIFSLLSKGMALTLPFILLLIDYLLEKKFDKKILKEKIPFFTLAVIFVVITIFAQYHTKTPNQETSLIFFHNLLIASHGLTFYLVKTFLPTNLSALYPYPKNILRLLPLTIIFLPIFLLIFIYLIRTNTIGHKKIIFGLLFFLINILPFSELIPVVGAAIAADRYTYIPSIGLFYLISEVLWWFYKNKLKDTKILQRVLLVIFTGIIIILSSLTYQRCKVWKDSITLWNDVLKKYPYNPTAHNNRGRAYSSLGEYDKAIADYNQALSTQVSSDDLRYALIYFNRGIAYFNKNEYDSALADYNQVLKLKPDFAAAYEERGLTYFSKKEYDKALADYNKSLEIDPGYAQAYNDRGIFYFTRGDCNKALLDYNQAIKFNPNFAEAYMNRGDIFNLIGEYYRAIFDYTQAIKINPYYPNAYYNRAIAYSYVGEYESAIWDYTQALRINSNFVKAYNNRGNLYNKMGAYNEALADYYQALAIDSNFVEAYYNRSIVYYNIGEYEKALNDIRKVQSLGYNVDTTFVKILYKSISKQ